MSTSLDRAKSYYNHDKVSSFNTGDIVDLTERAEGTVQMLNNSFNAYKESLSTSAKLFVNICEKIHSLTDDEMKEINSQIQYLQEELKKPDLNDDYRLSLTKDCNDFVNRKIDIIENDKNKIFVGGMSVIALLGAFSFSFVTNSRKANCIDDTIENEDDNND